MMNGVVPARFPQRRGSLSRKLLIGAVPVAVLVFAVTVIVSRGGDKFGGMPEFPLATYRAAPGTIRGNSYVIRGQIDSRLGYTEGKGALLAVKLLDASGGRVAVYVPAQDGRNLESGQRYNMRVTVKRDLVTVESMEKL